MLKKSIAVATLGPEPGLPGDELLVVLCMVRFPAFTTCATRRPVGCEVTRGGAARHRGGGGGGGALQALWAARVLTHESWSDTF